MKKAKKKSLLYISKKAKPHNVALERLAQATTNKETVMASPLQAPVRLRASM